MDVLIMGAIALMTGFFGLQTAATVITLVHKNKEKNAPAKSIEHKPAHALNSWIDSEAPRLKTEFVEKHLLEHKTFTEQHTPEYLNRKLSNLNRLFVCKDCERYTRQHILELESLKYTLETEERREKHVCPDCGSVNLASTNDSYAWLDTHRHCYKIYMNQLDEHLLAIEKVKANIIYAQEMKAFEEYENKHLAPARIREDATRKDLERAVENPIERFASEFKKEMDDAFKETRDEITVSFADEKAKMSNREKMKEEEFRHIARMHYDFTDTGLTLKVAADNAASFGSQTNDYIASGQFLLDGNDPSETVSFRAGPEGDVLYTSRKHFEENKHRQGWKEVVFIETIAEAIEVVEKEQYRRLGYMMGWKLVKNRPPETVGREHTDHSLELIEVWTGMPQNTLKIMTRKDYEKTKHKTGWIEMSKGAKK